jgi:16S rRNA (cytosine967-C5)-methyltransferase
VLRVLEGQTLDTALADESPLALPDRDRAQVQSLAYGAVRWHHQHEALLERLLDRPLRSRDRILAALLSVGLYQLADPGQPDYAAVSSTVAAARLLGRDRAAGLVNGTLRRYQREAASLGEWMNEVDEARYSHPAWIVQRLRRDWPDHWREILAANQRHPPLWLRVRTGRISLADYQGRLVVELGLTGQVLAGAAAALKLDSPVAVGRLPGFAEGLVTVQDAASQLAAPLLGAAPGDRVLDACAAPGGKATHLLETGVLDLTALDSAAGRLDLVRSNLTRLGMTARLVAGDATEPGAWWDGRPFDRILVDAPCSATGVIRRHPDIKLLRRPEDLPALARRQRLMLERLWPLLRPGGRLLYSTCSLFREENGAVVRDFLAARADARLLPLVTGLPLEACQDGDPGLQLLPGGADTDGFYYALMEKMTG